MLLVLFDVDGTLIDSQNDIVEAQARAFLDHDLPPPTRDMALSVVGLSLIEAFKALAGPDAPLEALATSYKEAWTERRAQPGWRDVLYDGAAGTIAALAVEPRVVLGLATGKSRRGIDRLIDAQGWPGTFATIQTADEHPSKPHPSMILAAVTETGVPPSATIMVGDTTYDVEMAVAAGAQPIGVAWGYHAPAALRASGAATIAENFSELRAILRERAAEQ